MRYLLILSMFFFACSGSEDKLTTTMTIVNNRAPIQQYNQSITRVSLVGYDFDNLNIVYGVQSKTFELEDGINGGYDDVNVNFEVNCAGTGYVFSESVVFLEGGNTTITLMNCPNLACDCVKFSFSG